MGPSVHYPLPGSCLQGMFAVDYPQAREAVAQPEGFTAGEENLAHAIKGNSPRFMSVSPRCTVRQHTMARHLEMTDQFGSDGCS